MQPHAVDEGGHCHGEILSKGAWALLIIQERPRQRLAEPVGVTPRPGRCSRRDGRAWSRTPRCRPPGRTACRRRHGPRPHRGGSGCRAGEIIVRQRGTHFHPGAG
ncbi:MAG: hypothetical protein EON52_12170, partial [Actinomycetales bacterium]